MNCKLTDEYLMKYFDKDLNDIETAQMKQHFKVCNKCSEEFEELSEIFKILENETLVEPPLDFEINVMQKVNSFENVRRKRNDRFLIMLYSLTSMFIILVSMLVTAIFKDLSTVRAIQSVAEYLNSFSSTMIALFDASGKVYCAVAGLTGALLQVSIALVKTYNYVFAILLGMLLIMQRMFESLARHDNGGMG